jgi:hypothetical protein
MAASLAADTLRQIRDDRDVRNLGQVKVSVKTLTRLESPDCPSLLGTHRLRDDDPDLARRTGQPDQVKTSTDKIPLVDGCQTISAL